MTFTFAGDLTSTHWGQYEGALPYLDSSRVSHPANAAGAYGEEGGGGPAVPCSPPPVSHLQATGPSGSKMQLLETEFSRSVPELIELHLLRQDSIPAFLSALTLELFSHQTAA